MGQGTAGCHQKEHRSKQEAPSDPPGHSLLRGVVILPELHPIPAVELLLAGQLADFMIGRATLPAYHRMGISEGAAELLPDKASEQLHITHWVSVKVQLDCCLIVPQASCRRCPPETCRRAWNDAVTWVMTYMHGQML